jgi:hypothetical protein
VDSERWVFHFHLGKKGCGGYQPNIAEAAAEAGKMTSQQDGRKKERKKVRI